MTNDEIINRFRSGESVDSLDGAIREMIIDFAIDLKDLLDKDRYEVTLIMNHLNRVLALSLRAATCNT